MRRIDEIIIHCTDNRFDSKITMDDLRRDHIRRGFRDIGYHYVIFYDGTIRAGRPLNEEGAHCKKNGHNKHSIGIAYVGGRRKDQVNEDTRSLAQKNSLKKLIRELLEQFPTIKTIVGHCDYDHSKVCPCFNARAEYSPLLKR